MWNFIKRFIVPVQIAVGLVTFMISVKAKDFFDDCYDWRYGALPSPDVERHGEKDVRFIFLVVVILVVASFLWPFVSVCVYAPLLNWFRKRSIKPQNVFYAAYGVAGHFDDKTTSGGKLTERVKHLLGQNDPDKLNFAILLVKEPTMPGKRQLRIKLTNGTWWGITDGSKIRRRDAWKWDGKLTIPDDYF